MKKLENFIKREEELEIWRGHATPEDIEYYECQLELQQELLKSYNQVERIIGIYHVTVYQVSRLFSYLFKELV